jgi:Na+-transporting methylmalonyl-CoA/oxaloacetate decarboxylase gamma subunit
MQYPMSQVLLITSVSMAVLFLVLAALAVMVNWLIKVRPERDAPREDEIAKGQTPVAASDGQKLDQLAAVVGVALARARAGREPARQGRAARRAGFTPWCDLARSTTVGHLDRGWRPR